MSRFNYYLQLTLLTAAVILALIALAKKDFIIFLVILQFLVGVLQIFVAIVLVLNKRTRFQGLILYLILSGALVLILFLYGEELWLLVFTIPWLLAINFCRLSYRLYIRNNRSCSERQLFRVVF